MNNKFSNPLDSVFNLDPGQDDFDIENEYGAVEVQKNQAVTAEPAPDIKDADDIQIEQKIDEVYEAAITAFNQQNAYTEIIEPRYAARNAEVAANYLSIALNAANSRAKVKTDRKRANQAFVPYTNSKSTTNVLVASREEILKMISVDGEVKKI